MNQAFIVSFTTMLVFSPGQRRDKIKHRKEDLVGFGIKVTLLNPSPLGNWINITTDFKTLRSAS